MNVIETEFLSGFGQKNGLGPLGVKGLRVPLRVLLKVQASSYDFKFCHDFLNIFLNR